MLGLLIYGSLMIHEWSIPDDVCYGLPDEYWESQQ